MAEMNPIKQFCSTKCSRQHASEQKYTGLVGIDYITCPLCNLRTRQFTPDHAKMHGYKSIQEMATENNISKITCDSKAALGLGDKNAAFNHGGKLSPWSKNFVHGYDDEKHKEKIKQHKKLLKDNPEKFKNNIAYWLKETNGNTEAAIKLHKKFQSRTLEWFTEKYGEEEGKKRHALKTERWVKSFKKTNFSKISQELFNEVIKHVDVANVYFATFDRPNMKKYLINKEYFLNLGTTHIRPDFIDLVKKRIIEFDGEYWHSPIRANPSREASRDKLIIDNGYSVLHVNEIEYKTNKQKVIQECINFLTK
jgi:hypothetical protein